MSLRVTFEVSNRDLKHFRREMRRAREAVRIAEDEEIIRAAQQVLDDIRGASHGDLVRQSADRLEDMIRMIEDADWQLPAKERTQVLCALAYFGDPDDLIPDSIPGIGFLDDAIMVELVFRELRHDLEAYRDFRGYRIRCRKDAGLKKNPEALTAALAARRRKLHDRMRRRRQRDKSQKAGAGRSVR